MHLPKTLMPLGLCGGGQRQDEPDSVFAWCSAGPSKQSRGLAWMRRVLGRIEGELQSPISRQEPESILWTGKERYGFPQSKPETLSLGDGRTGPSPALFAPADGLAGDRQALAGRARGTMARSGLLGRLPARLPVAVCAQGRRRL